MPQRESSEQMAEPAGCRTPGCRTRPKPGYAPRGLCLHCETAGLEAIEALLRDHADLESATWGDKPRLGAGVIDGHDFGPSLPFDASADALAREIIYTAVVWENPVRDRAHLAEITSKPPFSTADLARACATLSAHYAVLVALPRIPYWPYEGLAAEADGPDAVVALTELHRRARSWLGVTYREYVLPDARCSVEGCGFGQLRHRDGRDQVYCPACHAQWTWDQYRDTVETALFGGPR